MLSQPPTFAVTPLPSAMPRSAKGCAIVPPECCLMPRNMYAFVKSRPDVNVRRLGGAVDSCAGGVAVLPVAAGAEDGPAADCARAGVDKSPATHIPHINPAIVLMHPPCLVVSGFRGTD